MRSRPRRSLLFLLVLVVLPAACTAEREGPSRPEAPRSAQSRAPNVLLILTDDQPVGSMGVMPKTLRWFRKGGVYFPNAFATTPQCCPSRASILTGQYAHNHGVRRNIEATKLDHRATLQRYLQREGYLTGALGKYLNEWKITVPPPGFDRWTFISGSYPNGYYGGRWNINGDVRTVPSYSTRFLGSRAGSFLRTAERQDARPWFLYLGTIAPHWDLTAEPKYRGASVPPLRVVPAMKESDRSDKPAYVQVADGTMTAARRMRRGQLRTLMSVDDLVAKIRRMLRKMGEERSTLAFFMSDNGWLWGEHGLSGHLETKRNPYTRSIQVPMYMRWPGRVEAGSVDRRLVANVDVTPTILDALDVETRPGRPVDGRSLLRAWRRRSLLIEYWQQAEYLANVPDWASLRTAGYQYVEYRGDSEFREYYDLRDDPSQLHNLLADGDPRNDPRVARLHRRLAGLRRCAAKECP